MWGVLGGDWGALGGLGTLRCGSVPPLISPPPFPPPVPPRFAAQLVAGILHYRAEAEQ